MVTVRNRIALLALPAGTAVSLVGNTLAQLAIPWYVLETTGSTSLTGIAAFWSTIPLVLSALLSGAVIDRLGPRRSIIASDAVAGVTIALIPLLHEMGGLAYGGCLHLCL